MHNFRLDPLKSPIAPITGETSDPIVTSIIAVGLFIAKHLIN